MIKFRVWDTYEEEMYDDVFFTWEDCGYESLNECLNDKRFIFLKSTGLKDRHGNMIYEGDIVDKGYHNYKIYPNQWGSVGMGETYASGYNHGKWLGWLTSAGYSLLDIYDLCEVLGNIYENPELMEDERYFNLYDFQTKL